MDQVLEAQIVTLRTNLLAQGFDAGALTIHWHLPRTHGAVPSVSSAWRVLRRRGLVKLEAGFKGLTTSDDWKAALRTAAAQLSPRRTPRPRT